jgi:hypothetical protein
VSKPVRIASQGFAVTPPAGWEATIYRRPPEAGATTHPVLQAATVPLTTAERADYGGGLVETLTPSDAFVSLLDFGPEAAGTALFAAQGLPGLSPDVFDQRGLQRALPGQAGVQRFFHIGQRALCLYVVLGGYTNRVPLTFRVNQLLGGLEITPTAQ